MALASEEIFPSELGQHMTEVPLPIKSAHIVESVRRRVTKVKSLRKIGGVN